MSALTFVTADAPFTDSGNTAWVLAAAALVLFMTPGLALFYGGMVRTKSVLNMMMMSFITMGTVGTVWILWGYSETFGTDVGGGLIGNPFDTLRAQGRARCQIYGYVPADAPPARAAAGGIPGGAFVAFQVVFAIIAVALVSGAIADRAKFVTWTVFTVDLGDARLLPRGPLGLRLQRLRGRDGWLDRQQGRRALPRRRSAPTTSPVARPSTSTPVSRASPWRSCSASASGWPKEPMRPHNLTLVMIGAGILWFGWFGFNAGSALGAGTLAAGVWVNTLGATCTAMLGWLIVEKIRDGHADLARRGLRCRRRPRRHHPGLCHGLAVGRPRRRSRRRCRAVPSPSA